MRGLKLFCDPLEPQAPKGKRAGYTQPSLKGEGSPLDARLAKKTARKPEAGMTLYRRMAVQYIIPIGIGRMLRAGGQTPSSTHHKLS